MESRYCGYKIKIELEFFADAMHLYNQLLTIL